MAKRKTEAELYSYGIFDGWDSKSKAIPKLLKITDQIPAIEGIEFGYVLKIKGAKGALLRYRIAHPGIRDENGKILLPFDGVQHINSNDWQFFLGDSIWLPLNDKTGNWTLTTWINDVEVARKTFRVRHAE